MKAVQKQFLHELKTETVRFKDFSAIPLECLNTANIKLWMETVFEKEFINPAVLVQKIPQQYITDDLLKRAIDLLGSALDGIKPSHADDYPALVLHAFKAFNYLTHFHIDDNYKTEALLDMLIENEITIDMKEAGTDWVKPLLNQERIDKLSAYDFWFAMGVGFENVSWDVVKTLLKKNTDEYQHLEAAGRLDYLTRMLVENEWPAPKKGFQYSPLKNLADGVARFMKTDRLAPTHFLFKAYVKSFPVDQVIGSMNTPARRKVLLNMYPTNVLRQHSGGDRDLRGMLLEDEMGL